jgi:hypothetical protein
VSKLAENIKDVALVNQCVIFPTVHRMHIKILNFI